MSAPSPAPGHAAARGAFLLIIQRVLTVAGGVALAATLPRVMGPATYGRYALLAALATWLASLTGLGLISSIARYVPQLSERSPTELNGFLGRLLVLRIGSASLGALACLIVGRSWLPDVATWSVVVVAAAMFMHGVTSLIFATFLGLGRPARWGLAELLRRWLSVALIAPAFVMYGLGGAFVALLAVEVCVLTVGLAGGRDWLTRVEPSLDLRPLVPYLKLGAAFFATQVLSSAFGGSGELMVRAFSGSYEEVGYFGLANGGFAAVAMSLPELTLAFVPLLSGLYVAGQTRVMARWVERLLTTLICGAMLGLFAASLLGVPLVVVVLGVDYMPVARCLAPFAFALLMQAVGSVGGVVSLVHERSTPVVAAASLRLVVFWSLGPLLVAHHGALGAAYAVAAAAALHALTLVWLLRDTLRRSSRAPALALTFGVVVVPLLWLRSSFVVDVVLFLVATGVYGALVLRAGLFRMEDFTAIREALRWRRAAPVEGIV